MTIEEYVGGVYGERATIYCENYEQTVDMTRRLIEAGANTNGSEYAGRISNGSEHKKDMRCRHPFVNSVGNIEYYFEEKVFSDDEDIIHYSDFENEQDVLPTLYDDSCIPESFCYLKGAFAV